MKYLMFVFVALLFSCSEKHKEQSSSDDGEWKEMEEFHTVMADVYHPLKDSNDLGPIKQHSGELAKSASDWASSKLPAKVDNQQTKDMLSKLENGCKKLDQMVKDNAPDEDLSRQLTALHDEFHALMERWHHKE